MVSRTPACFARAALRQVARPARPQEPARRRHGRGRRAAGLLGVDRPPRLLGRRRQAVTGAGKQTKARRATRRLHAPAGVITITSTSPPLRCSTRTRPEGSMSVTELRVNGAKHRLDTDPTRSLLSVLRDDLDLTGCKYG